MEARHSDTLTGSTSEDNVRIEATERLVDDLKAVIQRAGEKAVERGKAADQMIRDLVAPTPTAKLSLLPLACRPAPSPATRR